MPFIGNLTTQLVCFLALGYTLLSPNVAAASSVFDLGERHFQHLSQTVNLPGRIVTGIAQDNTGYLWLSTQQGLARFDGYQSTLYNYSPDRPSIAGDDIRSLWIDPQDQLWIGTFSDGLTLLSADRQSFQHFRHQADNPNSISDDWIRSITGTDDRVWLGTDRGLDILDKESHDVLRIKQVRGCPDHHKGIRKLLLVQQKLWMAGRLGVCIVDTTSLNTQQRSIDGTLLRATQTKEVVSLYQDSNNTIWLGTRQQGAFYIDAQNDSVVTPVIHRTENFNTQWISDITQVKHEIWLATSGGGIIVVDIESKQFIQHLHHRPSYANSLSIDDISTLFQDRSGLLWIGTFGDGLIRYNPINDAFRVIKQSNSSRSLLSHKDIQSLLVAENHDIWLGSRGGGIDILTLKNGIRKHFDAVNTLQNMSGYDHITALAQTRDGTIWVGTRQQGLWRYDEDNETFHRASSPSQIDDAQIISLASGNDGRLWIGSEHGLHLWRPETDEIIDIKDIVNAPVEFDLSVWALAISTTGRVWVGTSEGLYSIATNSMQLERMDLGLTVGDPLSNKNIVDLMIDRYGMLWVSTASGLDRLQSWQGNIPIFESVKHKIGLPNITTWGTLFQDAFGRVWTEKYVIDTKEWRAYRLLSEDGWTIGNQWHGAVSLSHDGIFLLGGTEGVLLVDPSRFQPWQYAPPLVINAVRINGLKTTPSDLNRVQLPPNTRSFSIEATMLDFLQPTLIRYRYRLLGFDDNWTETGFRNRTFSFTNLDAGRYQLEIQATNSAGEWQPSLLSMTLEQSPAWYQTLLFKILFVMAFIILFFLIYRFRVLQLQRQKQALDALVQKRTSDIISLGDIGQEITASLDLGEIAQQVYRHSQKFMGADTFILGVLDQNNTHIQLKFIMENGQQLRETSLSMGDLNRAAVWCISNQKELVTSQTSDLLRYLDIVQDPISGEQSESIIYLPLIIENRTLGCVSVQSHEKNAFDDNQLQMLKTIASYAAIALDNANTHQQLSATLNELQDKNEALAAALQEIEKISLVDQLTGASNRRFLDKFIPVEISKMLREIAKNPDERLGFLLLDADHFKQVNDTYGHEAGDRVLIQIVENLREVCRESDWIIRLGGEEFLVIAKVENQDAVEILAERIREKMAQHPFDLGEGQTIHKTCSIGLCCFPMFAVKPDALRWEDILNLSDRALYAVKHNGRNGWVHIKPGSNQDVNYFQRNFQHLDKAISQNIVFTQQSKTLPEQIEFVHEA